MTIGGLVPGDMFVLTGIGAPHDLLYSVTGDPDKSGKVPVLRLGFQSYADIGAGWKMFGQPKRMTLAADMECKRVRLKIEDA